MSVLLMMMMMINDDGDLNWSIDSGKEMLIVHQAAISSALLKDFEKLITSLKLLK